MASICLKNSSPRAISNLRAEPANASSMSSHVAPQARTENASSAWRWLGGETGQLGHRDKLVPNLGSLLDAAATVTPVP